MYILIYILQLNNINIYNDCKFIYINNLKFNLKKQIENEYILYTICIMYILVVGTLFIHLKILYTYI